MSTKNIPTVEQVTEAGHDEANAGKVIALCQHLECGPDELTEESYEHYNLTVYSYGREEYAVGTDEEADEAWDQSLDSYFDEEMWKRDAKMDGRGHSLSSYDGNEEEVEVDGVLYSIFRVN